MKIEDFVCNIGKSDMMFKVAIYQTLNNMDISELEKKKYQDIIVNWLSGI